MSRCSIFLVVALSGLCFTSGRSWWGRATFTNGTKKMKHEGHLHPRKKGEKVDVKKPNKIDAPHFHGNEDPAPVRPLAFVRKHEKPLPKDQKFAYVSLATTEGFFIQALTLMDSVRTKGTRATRVIMYTKDAIYGNELHLMAVLLGITCIPVQPVKIPKDTLTSLRSTRLKERIAAFTKIRLWQLTQFDKVVYLDADMLARHSLDFLFNIDLGPKGIPASTPKVRNEEINALLVLQPSLAYYKGMMDLMNAKLLIQERVLERGPIPDEIIEGNKTVKHANPDRPPNPQYAWHTGDMEFFDWFFTNKVGHEIQRLPRGIVWTMYKKRCMLHPYDDDLKIPHLTHFVTGVGNISEICSDPPKYPEVVWRSYTTRTSICQREWLVHWRSLWDEATVLAADREELDKYRDLIAKEQIKVNDPKFEKEPLNILMAKKKVNAAHIKELEAKIHKVKQVDSEVTELDETELDETEFDETKMMENGTESL